MTKNPVFQFVLWSFFLSHPVFAQEAIQIEIDSAPVEIELQKPVQPAKPSEPTPPPQAETAPEPEDTELAEEESGMGKYGVAIGIGALVAGVLAALGGGGGGGGGGSSTPPQH